MSIAFSASFILSMALIGRPVNFERARSAEARQKATSAYTTTHGCDVTTLRWRAPSAERLRRRLNSSESGARARSAQHPVWPNGYLFVNGALAYWKAGVLKS